MDVSFICHTVIPELPAFAPFGYKVKVGSAKTVPDTVNTPERVNVPDTVVPEQVICVE